VKNWPLNVAYEVSFSHSYCCLTFRKYTTWDRRLYFPSESRTIFKDSVRTSKRTPNFTKDQLVNAVYGNNRCLQCESHFFFSVYFVYSSLWDFKSRFTRRKILRHGTFPLYFPSERKVCCGFLSPLKIHRLGRVLNPQPLGRVQWPAH
jgi:hypothetical protein